MKNLIHTIFLILLSINFSTSQKSDFISTMGSMSDLDFDVYLDYSKKNKTYLVQINGNDFLNIKDKYYRFEQESQKKKGQKLYSVYMQEVVPKLSTGSVQTVGDRIKLIAEVPTVNDENLVLFSNDNYFAVVKTTIPFVQKMESQELFNGKGIDVNVFSTSDFKRIYSQSISLSSKEKAGKILDMKFDDFGNLTILTSLKYYKEHLNSDDYPRGEVKIIRITETGEIKTKELESRGFLMGHFSEKKGRVSHLISVRFSGKSGFNVSTIDANPERDNGSIDDKELTLGDIMNLQNGPLYLGNISKNLNDAEKLTVKLAPLESEINHYNDDFGRDIISYPLSFASSNWEAILFNLVLKVEENGQISWLQPVPILESYLTLTDTNNNIHIFTNAKSDNYENGKVVDNKASSIRLEMVPIEIVIDGQSGKVNSNNVFIDEDVPEKYIFQKNRSLRMENNIGIIAIGDLFGVIKLN